MSNKIYYNKRGYKGEIKLAKNQKVVQIHRVQKGINFESQYKALRELTTDAYALFSYLIMCPTEYPWALSSKDVIEHTSLSIRTYNKAIQELIEKRYLVQQDIDMDGHYFTENAYHLLENNLMKYDSEINKWTLPKNENA